MNNTHGIRGHFIDWDIYHNEDMHLEHLYRRVQVLSVFICLVFLAVIKAML